MRASGKNSSLFDELTGRNSWTSLTLDFPLRPEWWNAVLSQAPIQSSLNEPLQVRSIVLHQSDDWMGPGFDADFQKTIRGPVRTKCILKLRKANISLNPAKWLFWPLSPLFTAFWATMYFSTHAALTCGMIVRRDRRSWSPIVAISTPSITIRPPALSRMRNNAEVSVDLPAPVRPTIPIC